MLDQVVRPQLMKMLAWYIAIQTDFSCNPGKYGKYFQKYLDPGLWDLLMATYTDAEYDHTWDALENMCQLFRITSQSVAKHFGFEYPFDEDHNVSAHIKHVRSLPKDAEEMY